MIFVTVGTTPFPFLRMRSVVEGLIENNKSKEKIIYQHGNVTPVISSIVKNFRSLPYLKIQQYMKQARIIICHGGPATIFQALEYGKIPIIIPREKRFGEHVNDHQVEFAGFMKSKSSARHSMSTSRELINYLTNLMNV